MAEQTQTVESQAAGQTPTTTQQTTEQKPDANAQANGGQSQTGAAGRVEELPDWAQRELKEARQEAQRYRNERKAADDAKAKADEDRLAQEAKWQELAQKRQTAVDELAPKAELADKLTDLVTAQYAAEIKDWPAEVKAMAPGDDASILAKLEWANKARPLATELLKDKAPVPGNGSRPKPIGVANKGQPVESAVSVKRNF